MKWTRFKKEFETGGALYELMNGGILKQDPDTPAINGRPNIYVCEKPNLVVNNCFRIYDTDPLSFERDSIDGNGAPNIKYEHYQKWYSYDNLKPEYFDEAYFDVGYFERDYCQKRFIDNDIEYFNKTYKTEHRKKIYGNRIYPRPHPFEIHCGGWAHFYDMEIRRGDTDHALYFKWDRENKSVTIYKLQTKPEIGLNVNVNVQVNITKPPGSQDPPPPPLHPPWY